MRIYIFSFFTGAFFLLGIPKSINSQNLLKESSFQTDDISWICNNWQYIDFQIDYHYNYWKSQYKNEAKFRHSKWQRYKYRDCGKSGCKCCNYHSPDFEFDEPVNGYRNIYVGIGYCELIQQQLLNENNLIPGKFYKVNFKIKVPTKYQNGHNTITSDSKLKFFLAKNKTEYKKPGFEYGKDNIITDMCNTVYTGIEPEGYNEYKHNGFINLKSIYLINYEKDIWHEVSFVFKMPDEGTNKHDWFVADVAGGVGYTYIDDITLEETFQCNTEDPCSPTDGEINPTPPTKIYPDYKNYAVLNLDNVYSATEINILNDIGQLIDVIPDIYCDNGIKKVEWDAEKSNVYTGNFKWHMKLTNDCGDYDYTKSFDVVNPYNNPTLYPITNDCVTGINIPAPCCEAEPNILIENETLEGSSEISFHAFNNLTVRNTLVKSSAKNVTFKAGNEIILDTGFETEEGANVEMSIESCDDKNKDKKTLNKELSVGKFLSDDEQVSVIRKNNLHESVFYIYPNPASDFFEISLTSQTCDIKNSIFISITDVSGKEYYHKQFENYDNYFSKKINISNYPSGIYFVTFTGNRFSETKKLIIQ